ALLGRQLQGLLLKVSHASAFPAFQPAVTLGFQLQGQLLGAGLDDPAIGQNMNVVRHDVIAQAQIVGNHDETALAVTHEFTPSATTCRASISNPESVSSRMHKSGSSSIICMISLRFFSPPEKPSLTPRLRKLASRSTRLLVSRASFMNSTEDSSGSPRCLRLASTDTLRNSMLLTPGISTGYWNA